MRLIIAFVSLGLAAACTSAVRVPPPDGAPDETPLPIDPSGEEQAPPEQEQPPPEAEPPPNDPPPPPEEEPIEEPVEEPIEEPVSPATHLTVTAGPELVDALPGCQCTAPAPASNVDLSYFAAGEEPCGKPTNVSCGIDGPNCRCSLGAGLGDALWGSARTEEPRQPGEQWIIDEQIVHEGGGDGTFFVRAALPDDCLVSPGSLSLSANYGCCLLDCDGSLGNACYDYSQGGSSCSLFCDVNARAVTNADCMARGPVPVRIRVESDGGAPIAREWCVTMNDDESVDAIGLRRTSGVYTIESVHPSLVEITPGASCP